MARTLSTCAVLLCALAVGSAAACGGKTGGGSGAGPLDAGLDAELDAGFGAADAASGSDGGHDGSVTDASDGGATDVYVEPYVRLAPPTFVPAAGTVQPGVLVIEGPAGFPADGEIYYTTDGSAPTHASFIYSGEVPLQHSETVTAIATAPGFMDSFPASASYVVNGFDCGICGGPPVISPTTETTALPVTVTITQSPGAALCYTIDGTVPVCSNGACVGGTLTYSGAFTLDATDASFMGQVMVNAMGCQAGVSNTGQSTVTYTFQLVAAYLSSQSSAGAGLPGWDWSGTGVPATTMTLPADAGSPYGPFTASQVGDLPCTSATSCTGAAYPLADFLCWSKASEATCACASPLPLTAAAPSATLPAAAEVGPGDTLSVVACQSATPVNAAGSYAPSIATTVQF